MKNRNVMAAACCFFVSLVFSPAALFSFDPIPKHGSLTTNDDSDESEIKNLKILKVVGTEPTAKVFSLDKAVRFLDRTSMAWTNRHKCFTCHTNFIHLISTASLETKPKYYQTIKTRLVEMVEKRWAEKGPRWDAEVVMAATSLAFDARENSQKLTPALKSALDRIWKVQQKDGGFDWLKCDWPPMESDDEYGAVIAAVGVSAAPENYAKSDSAKAGVAKLKSYLKTHKIERLHHRAMLIWAESLAGGWITKEETDSITKKLVALQRPDGGWNTPSIGKWDRDDGQDADLITSDGYATGFSIFILKCAGHPTSSPAIQKGLSWLRKNQRESGRWYTRSVSRDNKHYLTHAGTAMAIMAFNACEEEKK